MVAAYGSGRSSPWEPMICEDEALECLCGDTISKIFMFELVESSFCEMRKEN